MTKDERQGIVLVALVCTVVTVYLLGRAVARAIEAFGPHDVRVDLVFTATEQLVGAPTSPSGITMGLDDHVTTSIASAELSGLALVLLALADVVALLGVAGAVTCFGVFLLQVLRGEPFNRRARGALGWLAVSASVGFAVWSVCTAFGTNTVLGDLGYRGFGDVERDTSGVLLTAAMLLVLCPLLLAFRIGGRLARETEGLV